MSFDDDADIPMNDLMKQWGVPHQKVISLISGAKRMTPDGNLAAQFNRRGYPAETHPSWFGTRQQLVALLVEVDATLVELVALVAETLDDTVYTPKMPSLRNRILKSHTAQRSAPQRQRNAVHRSHRLAQRTRRRTPYRRRSRIFFSRTASPTRRRAASG